MAAEQRRRSDWFVSAGTLVSDNTDEGELTASNLDGRRSHEAAILRTNADDQLRGSLADLARADKEVDCFP